MSVRIAEAGTSSAAEPRPPCSGRSTSTRSPKVLPRDHQVTCLVLSAGSEAAPEASLAENFHRLAMNPADEAQAFAALIEAGATTEQVAHRFGLTARFVEGRLRLATLAPVVFDALAAGEIILEALGELGGAELAARYVSVKKADLAASAERIFAGATIAEVAERERALAWVPDVMRFPSLAAEDEQVAPSEPSLCGELLSDGSDPEPEPQQADESPRELAA